MKIMFKMTAIALILGLLGSFNAQAADAEFEITPNDDSVITFKGYKPLGSQVGGFSEFEGTVTLTDDDLSTLKVEAEINMLTFYTVEPVLKDVLANEDFFNNAKYPAAKFTSSKVEVTDEADVYNVTGMLELIGVSKELSFPATITKTAKGITVSAEFKLNRETWGMNKSWKDSAIYDEVDISMELLAEPKKKS